MDWIPLLGAVGAGAIATKLLDVLWLQKVVHESDRRKWLREQRMKAYGSLSRELIAKGLWTRRTNEAEVLPLIADAAILTTDRELIRLLEAYVPDILSARLELDRFVNNGTSTSDERGAMRSQTETKVHEAGLALVARLRDVLINQ